MMFQEQAAELKTAIADAFKAVGVDPELVRFESIIRDSKTLAQAYFRARDDAGVVRKILTLALGACWARVHGGHRCDAPPGQESIAPEISPRDEAKKLVPNGQAYPASSRDESGGQRIDAQSGQKGVASKAASFRGEAKAAVPNGQVLSASRRNEEARRRAEIKAASRPAAIYETIKNLYHVDFSILRLSQLEPLAVKHGVIARFARALARHVGGRGADMLVPDAFTPKQIQEFLTQAQLGNAHV